MSWPSRKCTSGAPLYFAFIHILDVMPQAAVWLPLLTHFVYICDKSFEDFNNMGAKLICGLAGGETGTFLEFVRIVTQVRQQ